MSKHKEYLEWDTSKVYDYLAEQEIERAKDIDNEDITEDEARERAYEDSDGVSMEWGNLTERLTEWMQKKNDTKYWHVRLNNFGWRHSSGEKYFTARDGKELLRAVLPDTDCTFKIYHDGRYGLIINNAHHDAPTGGEMYYIRRATVKEQNAGYFD